MGRRGRHYLHWQKVERLPTQLNGHVILRSRLFLGENVLKGKFKVVFSDYNRKLSEPSTNSTHRITHLSSLLPIFPSIYDSREMYDKIVAGRHPELPLDIPKYSSEGDCGCK
jgi:hypothetical protein